jgi:hypothetical protein
VKATEASRAALVWVVATALLGVVYLVGTIDATFDLRADRLVTKAAIDGLDPYAPVDSLADRYGSDLHWDHVHPRTPGALVLQLPLAFLSESLLRSVAVGMTAAALAGTVLVGLRLWDPRLVVSLAVVAVFAITSPAVESATVGAQSSVVAFLLAVAWWRARHREDAVAGVALGVAVTLKLFPWLIVVLLMFRRPRTGLVAIGSGVVLNGLGLLYPGVDVPGVVTALSSTTWSGSSALNGSVVRLLDGVISHTALALALAAVGLAATFLIARQTWSFDRQWFAVLGVCLVVSPLVWRHYALALIPALLWMAARTGLVGRIVSAVSVVVLLVPFPLVTVRLIIPMCLAVVAVAALTRPPDGQPQDAGAQQEDSGSR